MSLLEVERPKRKVVPDPIVATKVAREVQELIPRLEIADRQLQLYKDSIELISLGRDTLISQINEKLIDIPALND